MQQTKKTSYRQRVFELNDGSIQLVFGNEAPPLEAKKLLADHDIVEVISVSDHIESDGSFTNRSN